MTALVEDMNGKYGRRLYGYALRMTRNVEMAEDAVQKLWLKIWRKPSRLASLAEADNQGAWLSTVLYNVILDELRRRRETVNIDPATIDEPVAPTQFEATFARQQLEAIPGLAERLNGRLREAVLIDLEHWHHHGRPATCKELAEAMGLPGTTAASYRRKGYMEIMKSL